MNHFIAAAARRFLAPSVLAGLTVLGTLGVAATASASPAYDQNTATTSQAPASTTSSTASAKSAAPTVLRSGAGVRNSSAGTHAGSPMQGSRGVVRTGGFGGNIHNSALPAHGGYGGHSARAYRH